MYPRPVLEMQELSRAQCGLHFTDAMTLRQEQDMSLHFQMQDGA